MLGGPALGHPCQIERESGWYPHPRGIWVDAHRQPIGKGAGVCVAPVDCCVRGVVAVVFERTPDGRVDDAIRMGVGPRGSAQHAPEYRTHRLPLVRVMVERVEFAVRDKAAEGLLPLVNSVDDELTVSGGVVGGVNEDAHLTPHGAEGKVKHVRRERLF